MGITSAGELGNRRMHEVIANATVRPDGQAEVAGPTRPPPALITLSGQRGWPSTFDDTGARTRDPGVRLVIPIPFLPGPATGWIERLSNDSALAMIGFAQVDIQEEGVGDFKLNFFFSDSDTVARWRPNSMTRRGEVTVGDTVTSVTG